MKTREEVTYTQSVSTSTHHHTAEPIRRRRHRALVSILLTIACVGLLLLPQLYAVGVEFDLSNQRVIITGKREMDPNLSNEGVLDTECIDRHGKKTGGGFWIPFSAGEKIKVVTASGKHVAMSFKDFRVGQKLIVSGIAQTPFLNIKRCVLLRE